MSALHELLATLARPLTDPGSRTWWPGLVLAAAVGLALSRRGLARTPAQALVALRTASSRLDAQLLLFRQLTRALRGASGGAAAWTLAVALVQALDQTLGVPAAPALPAWALTALYSAALFLGWDLSRFALHALMHRVPALWALHQVHHSATVLTPLTFHRVHPLESVLYEARGALATGGVAGLFYWVFRGQAEPWTLMGVPAVGMLLNVATGNLRHSGAWLRFPAALERWLLSPAQHQLHHSLDPRHHDANFGTWLAVWDRLYGSLLPSEAHPVAVGLEAPNHGQTLVSALLDPLRAWLPHRALARLAAGLVALGLGARTASAEDPAPAQEPAPTAPADAPTPGLEVIIYAEDGTPRVAGSAHRVDEETLSRFEYDDVERVLSQVPGVSTRGEDGYGLRPNIGIRGANSDRSAKITLLEDGVLFGPAPYAAPAAYYFPMSTRLVGVEVFKGPAATRNGPSTVGGVLNVLTRPVPADLGWGVDLAGGPRTSAKTHLWVGGTRGRWGFVVEGAGLHTAGFKELDGGGPTGFDRGEAMLKLRYRPSAAHSLELKAGLSGEHSFETYLGLAASDYAADPYRRYAASALDEMRWGRTQLELSWRARPAPGLELRTVAYHHHLDRSWTKFNRFAGDIPLNTLMVQDPTTGTGAVYLAILRGEEDSATPEQVLRIGTNHRTFHSGGVQSTLRWDHHLGPVPAQLEAGLRLHGDLVDRVHDEAGYDMVSGELLARDEPLDILLDSRSWAAALALHAHEDLRLGRAHLLPGLRTELISGAAYDRGGKPSAPVTRAVLLPGVGALHEVNDWLQVFGGAYRGFSPVAPGEPAEVRPETSWNYELGLRHHQGERRAEVVGFFNDYQNLVGQCTLASGCDEDQVDRQYNGGAVWVYGVELVVAEGLTLPWGGLLRVEGSWAYTGSSFRTAFSSGFPQFGAVEVGDALPYVPRHQGGGRLTLVQPSLDLGLGVSARSGMLDEAGSFPVGEGDVPPVVLVDAAARAQLTPRVALYATGTNLLGSTAVSSWRPWGARPVAPRQVMVGVKLGPPGAGGLWRAGG